MTEELSVSIMKGLAGERGVSWIRGCNFSRREKREQGILTHQVNSFVAGVQREVYPRRVVASVQLLELEHALP